MDRHGCSAGSGGADGPRFGPTGWQDPPKSMTAQTSLSTPCDLFVYLVSTTLGVVVPFGSPNCRRATANACGPLMSGRSPAGGARCISPSIVVATVTRETTYRGEASVGCAVDRDVGELPDTAPGAPELATWCPQAATHPIVDAASTTVAPRLRPVLMAVGRRRSSDGSTR